MLGWTRKKTPTDGTLDPESVTHCSFCGKDRKVLRQLVSGPTAAICNECIVLSFEVIEEATAALPGTRSYVAELLARRLRATTDPQRLTATIEAALAFAGDDVEELKRVAHAVGLAGHHDRALKVIARLPAGARDFSIEIRVVVLHVLRGAYEDAREHLVVCLPRDARERALRSLNEITVTLRLESDLDVVRLERMLGALGELSDEVGDENQGVVLRNRAEILLRLGEPHAAAETLRRIPGNATALVRMITGDVSYALGERRLAREAYEAAIGHANLALAEDLRRRLARLSDDPYR
ncbi:MAG: ClpX C4-type zinc finger protein [Polyangiales bacterium]